jgi:S1-C subfamily serine protease
VIPPRRFVRLPLGGLATLLGGAGLVLPMGLAATVPEGTAAVPAPSGLAPRPSSPPAAPTSGASSLHPAGPTSSAGLAAVTALVLAGGEQRGSAVILARASGGTWLVTNRHVVDGESKVCVRTADGRLWSGLKVLPGKGGGLDVAFLWLAGADDLPLARFATPAKASGEPWGFPLVTATGYPVREEPQQQPPVHRELAGLLLPLLPRPLEGGMQLATTATVRKGMSGGGLFDDQGKLIGLNTTHADPLWSAPLREEGGIALPPELNRKLERVALAIPLPRFLPLLAALLSPGSAVPAAPMAPSRLGKPSAVPPVCSADLW